jgi:2-methylcitrate dehydratase PrpD
MIPTHHRIPEPGPVFDRVADFTLHQRADQMPETALVSAALLFLDTLGICIAAAPMDAARIASDTATVLYGSSSPAHSARLLFDGRQVSLAGAGYAAATQIDNLDGHDGYNPTKGHIGVVAVPALAALAEQVPDLNGPDALAALVVGYEVAGRAGMALHASVPDYHTSGAWNALGIAAMAARLRTMPADKLREALGISEYHGPRSQMMREIANPTMLHDGSGWGAMVGLSAAVLAETGFTGAPAVTIEDPALSSHWDDLGAFWQVEHQYIKPYPVCRWAHAAIDAVRELCIAHDIQACDVASVTIRSFHNAVRLFAGMPDTTSQAQYSLPFAVAVMIQHGTIGLEHISGDGLSDPDIAGLVDKIGMIETANHQDRFPEGRWADAEITLTNGLTYATGDVHARGGPERPFTATEIQEKFMGFASPVLGLARATALRDSILDLTRPNSKFADLAALLYDPPHTV